MVPPSRRKSKIRLPACAMPRVGLWLFLGYLLLYGAFVLINAFRPDWMALRPWAEVNVAIWYGLGLIVAAGGVALVYAWLCRRQSPALGVGSAAAPAKERP